MNLLLGTRRRLLGTSWRIRKSSQPSKDRRTSRNYRQGNLEKKTRDQKIKSQGQMRWTLTRFAFLKELCHVTEEFLTSRKEHFFGKFVLKIGTFFCGNPKNFEPFSRSSQQQQSQRLLLFPFSDVIASCRLGSRIVALAMSSSYSISLTRLLRPNIYEPALRGWLRLLV